MPIKTNKDPLLKDMFKIPNKSLSVDTHKYVYICNILMYLYTDYPWFYATI